MDPRLSDHLAFALDLCQRHAGELSGACRLASSSSPTGNAGWRSFRNRFRTHDHDDRDDPMGHRQNSVTAASDILCQDLRRKLTGERPSDRYFREVQQLADMVYAGG